MPDPRVLHLPALLVNAAVFDRSRFWGGSGNTPHRKQCYDGLELAVARGAGMVSHAEVLRCQTGDAACTMDLAHRTAHARGTGAARKIGWKHGHYSAEATRVRRDARQQFRLLRQLIAAGNEDDVLDLISSM